MSNHYQQHQRCPDCSGYEFEISPYMEDTIVCKTIGCDWHGDRSQLSVGHKLQEKIVEAFLEGNDIKDIASSYGLERKAVAVALVQANILAIIKQKISKFL